MVKTRFFTGAILLALVAGASGCGGPMKYPVISSAKAPGADAKLIADIKEQMGSTQIEFTASNLPPPGRVVQGARLYVAWFREDSKASWKRIGGLDYDDGDREGRLMGSVSAIAFDFAVTAEAAPDSVSPSADVVFAQRVKADD